MMCSDHCEVPRCAEGIMQQCTTRANAVCPYEKRFPYIAEICNIRRAEGIVLYNKR